MQKQYKCHSWMTWDGWTHVTASSPALAALAYYESLADGYKHYTEVFVYEAHQSAMVEKPKKFYMSNNQESNHA